MTRLYNRVSEKEKRKRLRAALSPFEIKLWAYLRQRQVSGCKFRRQASIGPFVVDFYCPEARLAIEVDGDSHFTDTQKTYDKKREQYIKSFNIRILRFTNKDIAESLEGVINKIAGCIENKSDHP